MKSPHKTERQTPPPGIIPPISVDDSNQIVEHWSGQANLKTTEKTLAGVARVFTEMLPHPSIAFSIETEDKPTLRDMFEAMTGKKTWLGSATLDTGDSLGQLSVDIRRAQGTRLAGVVETQKLPDDLITSAKLLVINGPLVHGKAILRGNAGFCGRLQAEFADATVTVDQLRVEKPSHRSAFAFTHVAEIRFETPQPASTVESIQTTLFRALSLIHCRWVGLLGPWLYNDDQLPHFSPSVTKTSRTGSSFSWYPDTVSDVFDELAPCLHQAYSDPQRGEAIQTGFHWLIESSLCAGGVEGSLILQQAALESLAWYEIVQLRELCSISGFEKLPASDKVRWLASLYSITTDIPSHCGEILAYANAFGLKDLLEVLADVRNALIHGTPKKVERLLKRTRGEDELTELWYHIGGLLDQAVLAIIGYRGTMTRRDLDVQLKTSAIRKVPWVAGNRDPSNANKDTSSSGTK